MKNRLKALLKRLGAYLVRPHLAPPPADGRTSAAAKAAMRGLFFDLQVRAKSGGPLPRIADAGFRVFSQFEEDGYLLYLAAVLEIEPKTFIDVGSADGINSNCANLALNLGWHGLFIDGNEAEIDAGCQFYANHPDTGLYPPVFRHAFVTAENINDVIGSAGFKGDVGLVSIDLDGNDCWIWKALDVVSPKVVVIETHVEFGRRNIAVPYDPAYCYPGKHPDYHGASAPAMVSLGRKKGYRLVGANRYGFNLIFVRNDVFPERVPEVPVDVILNHPRYEDRLQLGEALEDWPYVEL